MIIVSLLCALVFDFFHSLLIPEVEMVFVGNLKSVKQSQIYEAMSTLKVALRLLYDRRAHS